MSSQAKPRPIRSTFSDPASRYFRLTSVISSSPRADGAISEAKRTTLLSLGGVAIPANRPGGRVARVPRNRNWGSSARKGVESAKLKDRLRFAFASCQHFGQGYFTAYQAMMEETSISSWISVTNPGGRVRQHLPEPITLEDYRNLHALYETDPHLQAAHAWHPFAVTWDDHEVHDDYADDQSMDLMPVEDFLRRRAAAYQAYYEHMPLRRRPIGPAMTLYRTLTFGDLAPFVMLDNRQYRSDQACQGPLYGAQLIEDCAERESLDRMVLGPKQERWMLDQLSGAKTHWRVTGQQALMAQLDQKQGAGKAFRSDGWDGYPAARQRILNHIKDHNIENCVVLGGRPSVLLGDGSQGRLQ